MSSISKAWRGEEKLWKVFWVYGVIGTIILWALYSIVDSLFKHTIGTAYLIIIFAYTLWVSITIWKCSSQTDWKILHYVTRIFIVFYLFSFVFNATIEILFGEELKKEECRTLAKEYIAQGGTDRQSFITHCMND